MMKVSVLALSLMIAVSAAAQKSTTAQESTRVFTTYEFSDPDPIADMGNVYPYYRFDGYTDTPTKREWKVIELENEYIRVMILPQIGGKIWTAWEKSTGKPFIYYNQVIKFRDVAMRGPWTSGGIEANYGIIGHTPNCATPVDYTIRKNPDGSASCFVGTLDLLTRTYWTIEINLPADKAYFTTRSFWNNTTSLEQPYYTWMNVGMPSRGNLEFIYPGTHYIGHSGEFSDWEINPDNGKDISFYENNNFGGPKSYHVIGKHSDFFGAYYHEEDFGMARFSLRDEKPGRKIWIWGLSRNGMIWEDLLTDNDGQYVEIQSGRLFNQASDGSNYTPFKQLGFAPHTADEWTEYWFPVKGIQGFVKANPYGALNVRTKNPILYIDFSPAQPMQTELKVYDGKKLIYSKPVNFTPLRSFADSLEFTGNLDNLMITLGDHALRYSADPKADILSRPVQSPEGFDWHSAFGLYTLGKEFLQQRYYSRAEEKLKEALEKDPHFLPALADLSMIAFRNLDYIAAKQYASKALGIDTYDPAANFHYGLANSALGQLADARDGFEIASLNAAYRGAAYTELSRIYFKEGDLAKAKHYATNSLSLNAANSLSLQILAVIARMTDEKAEAQGLLEKLERLTPLNHFIRFERYRWDPTASNKKAFTDGITNELPHESYLELADFYNELNLLSEGVEVLALAPENAEVYYHMAYLKDRLQAGSGRALLEKASSVNPALVFPFRASAKDVFEWASTQTSDWKPDYFLALIYWSRNNLEKAKELISACGEPNFAPFYAVRAKLSDNANYRADLRRAAQLEPSQWRYGKLLIDQLMEEKDYAEALKVASDYNRRFPNDFRIRMLLARAMLRNGQAAETASLLAKTKILPYEGATDGRRLYREAWLMQSIQQLKDRNYKAAQAALAKAKLWPENLGAGRPYDDMLDLRVENFIEALIYEKSKQMNKAQQKLREITDAPQRRRHTVVDLLTALAYRKTGRNAEGNEIREQWVKDQPNSELARWALDLYNGRSRAGDGISESDDFRIIKEIGSL